MTEQQKVLCPACNTQNDAGEGLCQRCGLPLSSSDGSGAWTIVCPRCQNTNNAGSFFCYTCGKYFADIGDGKSAGAGKKRGKGASHNGAVKAIIAMPGGTEIMLTGDSVFIERSDFDSTLPQDILMSISRQHVLITYSRGKYYVRDYGRDGKGSTNHTRLNGNDIYSKGKKALKDGDKIELACQPELTMTFRLVPKPD